MKVTVRRFSAGGFSMRWRHVASQSAARGRSLELAVVGLSAWILAVRGQEARWARIEVLAHRDQPKPKVAERTRKLGMQKQCWLTCTQPWHRSASRRSWRSASARIRRVSAKTNATTATSSWVYSSYRSLCTSSHSSATWTCARSSNEKYPRRTKTRYHQPGRCRTMKPQRQCSGYRTPTTQQ